MPASRQQAERHHRLRHPGSSTPGAYASPCASGNLTGMLIFDSPPLVIGLRSSPGTLSHFSYQPGAGPYSPGTLSFDGLARDSAVRSPSQSSFTFPAHVTPACRVQRIVGPEVGQSRRQVSGGASVH